MTRWRGLVPLVALALLPSLVASPPTLADPPACSISGATLTFSNFTWTIRNDRGAPGNNTFVPDNVACDETGALHLKIAKRAGNWTAAEVHTSDAHGFGRYQFQVEGPIASFDPNVTLGLFSYHEPANLRDTVRGEVDVEYGTFGENGSTYGHFTVWPPLPLAPPSPDCPRTNWTRDLGDPPIHCTHTFVPTFSGNGSTHRFDWESASVSFASLDGFRDAGDANGTVETWTFAPQLPALYVPQSPMPVYLNLWLGGDHNPPFDQQDVEVVVKSVEAPP